MVRKLLLSMKNSCYKLIFKNWQQDIKISLLILDKFWKLPDEKVHQLSFMKRKHYAIEVCVVKRFVTTQNCSKKIQIQVQSLESVPKVRRFPAANKWVSILFHAELTGVSRRINVFQLSSRDGALRKIKANLITSTETYYYFEFGAGSAWNFLLAGA